MVGLGDTEGRAAVRFDKVGVDGEFSLSSRYEKVTVQTYEKGSFDPERALSGRLWVGDYPAINSAIEGRVSGHLTSWRQKISVDTQFSVDLGVLKVVKGTVGASGQSSETLDFNVLFHPK